ncbi:MAG: MOSC domain-containing protein [Cytophagales bacterium]|nr:MOSC domain-containing protein [Armatimonadota bacterium]
MPRQNGFEGAADPLQRPWFSGFVKEPVTGRLWLSSTGLTGDGVADTKNHGGPEKAVLAYARSHYADWSQQLVIASMPPASFGENFTVSGLTEETVCVGDTFAVGNGGNEGEGEPPLIQVSQPRQPCWKQERRLGRPGLIALMVNTGRTGWYFRVLREGWAHAGAELFLRERPFPEWTIARANRLRYHDKDDHDAMNRLAACPLLSPTWQTALAKK